MKLTMKDPEVSNQMFAVMKTDENPQRLVLWRWIVTKHR